MNLPVVHIETTLTSPRINASSAAHCGRTWPWQVYRAGEVHHSHVTQVFGKKSSTTSTVMAQNTSYKY